MNALVRFRDWWLGQYRSQRGLGKAVWVGGPALVALMFGCCFCSLAMAMFAPDSAVEPTAELAERAAATVDVATEELVEVTAAPTEVEPSRTAAPSLTPVPSRSVAPTATEVQATATVDAPVATAESVAPTRALFALSGQIDIISVDARVEAVDLQNVAGEDIMLDGWVLRFENSAEECPLDSVGLFPNGYTLRVWVGEHPPTPAEFSCGLAAGTLGGGNAETIVLVDGDGQEIGRVAIEASNRAAATVVVSTAVSPTAVPQPTTASQPTQPSVATTGDVVISSVRYDGDVPDVESDEFAVIANRGSVVVNIGGWRLNAGEPDQNFTFPPFDLQPGQSCRVYTNEAHPESCGFSFGRGDAIWRNSHDCGYLFNAEGAEVSRFCWN